MASINEQISNLITMELYLNFYKNNRPSSCCHIYGGEIYYRTNVKFQHAVNIKVPEYIFFEIL